MRITVIVLSYNGTADTLACLESLRSQASTMFDVLVVDNASSDGAPAAIRAQYPQFPLIELPENLGWAGGNNVGIRRALDEGAEFICLLNNDTVVPPGAIAELAQAASRHAPCLMHPAIDFADAKEGAQLDPSKLSDKSPIDDGLYDLDFAYGACLMIPAEIFRHIGLFDERFFLQLEETDFWMRARGIGARSLCTIKARIVHAESRSFGGRSTPVKTYYSIRNSLLLIEKHHRTMRARLQALRWLYWRTMRDLKSDTSKVPTTLRLVWPFFRDPFLMAARAALRDYLSRSFGRISPLTYRSIMRQ